MIINVIMKLRAMILFKADEDFENAIGSCM